MKYYVVGLFIGMFIGPLSLKSVASEGERLAYVVGCINCHHQTPKEIINAPPLLIVQAYSYEDFAKLMRTGRTISGRDLLKIGSIMGIVAVEQFSHLKDEEIRAIYDFLRQEWTHKQALAEEAKIASLFNEKLPSQE